MYTVDTFACEHHAVYTLVDSRTDCGKQVVFVIQALPLYATGMCTDIRYVPLWPWVWACDTCTLMCTCSTGCELHMYVHVHVNVAGGVWGTGDSDFCM